MKKTSLALSFLLLFAGNLNSEIDESKYLWCEDTHQISTYQDLYKKYPNKIKLLERYGENFILSEWKERLFRFEEKKKIIHEYITSSQTGYWETSEVKVNYASLQWKGKSITSNFRKSCRTTSCSIKYSLNRKTLILNSDETYTPRQGVFDYSIKEEEHKLDTFECEVTSKEAVDLAIELHWKNLSPKNKI